VLNNSNTIKNYYLHCVGYIGQILSKKLYVEPVRKEYRKLQVDSMPIVESFEKLDYNKLLTSPIRL
jgi:hypothetical protein